MCHPLPCPNNIVRVGRSILLGEVPQRSFDGARGHDAEEMMKDPGLDLEARFVHGVCGQSLVKAHNTVMMMGSERPLRSQQSSNVSMHCLGP